MYTAITSILYLLSPAVFALLQLEILLTQHPVQFFDLLPNESEVVCELRSH